MTTTGLEWSRKTGMLSPIVGGETLEHLGEPMDMKGSDTMSKKQMRRAAKRLVKGLVQDSLNGTQAPELGGALALTGAQGLAPTTLGYKPIADLGPTNGVPGVSATIGGGESPWVIPAEGGLDFTGGQASKAAKRAARKTARKAAPSLVALSRLEMLAQQLRPNNPARLRAAQLILKSKLLAQHAGETGGIAKAVANMGDPDMASAIVASLQECEAALGIASSSTPWAATAIDPQAQLRRIMSGASSETLAGTQSGLGAYTSPAAALGQVLKQDDLGKRIAAAEREVAKAEQRGNSSARESAHMELTRLKLVAHHRLEGLR